MSASGEVGIDIQARDAATATLDRVEGSLREVGVAAQSTTGSLSGLGASSESASLSFGQLYGAASGAATGLFSMYMMVERVQNAQIALDKSNLRVSNDLDLVTKAQERYNEALKKYGPTAQETIQDAKDLSDVQEKQRIDLQVAEQRQQDYNNTIIQTGLFSTLTAVQIGTALIPIITKLGLTWGTIAGTAGTFATATEATGAAFASLEAGGVSASEAMALVGEGATSTASGLTAAAVATAAVVGGVAVAIGAFIGMGAVLVQTHKEGESFRETYGRIADGIHERFPGIAGDIIAAMALVPTGALQMAQDASAGLSNIWGQISSSTQGAMSQLGSSIQGAAAGAVSAFASVGAALGAIPLTTSITVNSLVDAAIGGFNQTVAAIAAIPLTKNVTIGSLISDALAGIQAVISALAGIVDKVVSIFVNWQVPAFPSLNIPGFQTGGILPYTGLFYGHKGEEVIPAQRASGTPSGTPSSFSFDNHTAITLNLDGQVVTRVVNASNTQRRQLASAYG